MVAFITGTAYGFDRSSAASLGSRGQIGQAGFGSRGDRVYVNATIGNLIVQSRDEFIAGRGPDNVLELTYNSAITDVGRWRSSVRSVIFGLTGTVNTAGSTIMRGGGEESAFRFTYDAARGAYVTTDGAGAHDEIRFADNVYTYTDGNSRTAERYDIAGQLLSITDADGNVQTYTYSTTGDQKKTTITSASGEITEIVLSLYNNTWYRPISEVSYYKNASGLTSTRSMVAYGYDALNRLTSVKVNLSPNDDTIVDNNYTTTYTYDGDGYRMASISQSDGSNLAIQYAFIEGRYRVASLAQTAAAGDVRTTAFAYDIVNRVTTITNSLGGITRMSYDAEGQLTQIVHPAATAGAAPQVFTYAYNASGDLVSATDASGNVTSYAYDANGNMTLERDAAGNTVTRTYGSRNELLTETRYLIPDPDGAGAAQPGTPFTRRFAYDSENHLRFTVSGEGRVTEYRYNDPGQQISAIQHGASRYNLAGLAPDTPLSEATLAAWANGIADKSTGTRTDTTYDFRGNVSTVTTYGKLLATGEPDLTATSDISRTVSIYDPNGRLLSRKIDGSASAETFVYDNLGRVVGSVDFNGFGTNILFDDANTRTVMTFVNGSTRTSVFNRVGELVSTIEAAAGAPTKTHEYRYDKLGRLRWSDEIGVRSYILYDKAGRKVADILPNGRITEYRYDANDRLIASISYKNKLTAAQQQSLIDANGNPSNVELAALRPVADATDIWEWRVYDKVTRLLLQTIDSAGATTVYTYDGAQNLTAKTAYSNLLAPATLATFKTTPPQTVVLPTANAAADRTERYFYEYDSNQVGMLDAEGYLTWTTWDPVGRHNKTVRFATAAAVEKRAAGTFADLYFDVSASNNPDDIYEYKLYDSRSLLRAEIGGEGELTRYNYSATGYLSQQVKGQKLDPAALRTTPPTLANLPASPAGTTLETTAYQRNLYGQLTAEVRTLSGGATETDWHYYNSARQLVKSVTRVNYGDERTALQRYDGRGNLIGELSGEGSAALAALGAGATTAQIDTLYRTYGTTYTYDNFDRLATKTTADGKGGSNRTVYFYNMYGLTSEFNALGEAVSYTYDHYGRRSDVRVHGKRYDAAIVATWTGGLSTTAANNAITALTDPLLDSVTHLDYNSTGTLAQSVNSAGATTVYGYNAFGEAISQTDPLTALTSTQTSRGFDRRGRLLSQTRDVGGLQLAETFGYDAFGRVLQVRDANGGIQASGYDRSGRLIRSTDALGKITTFTYDARGNLLSQIDRLGKKTSYGYDAFHRRLTVTTPEGIVSTVVKNAYGETLSLTDGAGRVTSYTYDRDGALKTATDGVGNVKTNNYDKSGKLIREIDGRGVATDYTYDAADRRLTRTTTDGSRTLATSYEYDAKGQQIKIVDPDGLVTTIGFDRNGRRTTVVVDPAGLALTTSYTYDEGGRMLTAVEGAGSVVQRVTQYAYDNAARRIRTSVDPTGLNLTTLHQYDSNGNVVVTTDALGAQTQFAYDKENRLVKTTDPLSNVTANTYDAEGRIIAVQVGIAAAQTTRFAYDRDGRLKYQVDAAGAPVEYVYDKAGNVIRTVEYAGTLSLGAAYDSATIASAIAAANLIRLAGTRSTRTAYDAANRPVFQIDAEGFVTETRFDANGRVEKEIRYELAHFGSDSDMVRYLFQAGLGRLPDNYTWAHYIFQLKTGAMSVLGVAQAIANSAEFVSRTAGMDNAALTRFMYLTAFGRAASDADVAYVSGLLAAGMSRGELIHLFTQSVELKTPIAAAYDPGFDLIGGVSRSDVIGGDHDDDRITRTFYDSAGRPVFKIDPEGYVTESRFDDGGRLASQIRYEVPYFGAEADTVRFLYQAGLGRIPDNQGWAHHSFQLKMAALYPSGSCPGDRGFGRVQGEDRRPR